MRRYGILLAVLLLCVELHAQQYSVQVELVQQDDRTVTLLSTALGYKKKEAADMAVRSAFNALFHVGVEGVRNGMPMIEVERADYDYRFFNENRYFYYMLGEAETVDDKKVGDKRSATVRLTINWKTLMADLEHNEMVISPAWANPKKPKATAALNPTIVVVPYVNDGGDFEDMRGLLESSPVVSYVVEKLSAEFGRKGYKTRDFLTQLQNASTSAMLHTGTQTDVATLLVQNLPGDIVVTVAVDIATDDRKRSECTLNVKAVERQTEGNLAAASFVSGLFMTTDSLKLADFALKQVKNDFFVDLKHAFEDMIAKGREVYIDMTLSQAVTDWDFDQAAPYGDDYFKDALDNWVREEAQQDVYDMSNSTNKYIRVRLNIPLWNMEKNRSYTLSNFTSDLRKFLKSQLGDDYGISITSMGQRLDVRIE